MLFDNFGFRYYDPELGRFIQRDPAGYPDGANNYLYCNNNPINRIDPLGLSEGDGFWTRAGRVGKTAGVVALNVAAWAFTGPVGGAVVTSATLSMAGGTSYYERTAQYQEATGEKPSTLQTATIVTADITGASPAYTAVSGTDPLTGEKVSPGDRIEAGINLAVGIGVGIGGAKAANVVNGSKALNGELAPTSPAGKGTATTVAEVKGPGANANKTINTPHEPAVQGTDPGSLSALQRAQNGETVYRQGILGEQNTGDAQFWSFDNPVTTTNYADKMGMPSSGKDWIMGGTVKPGADVITRQAPGIGKNKGGNIEAVTNPGGVQLDFFHMPD